jgi:thioredoxin reductase
MSEPKIVIGAGAAGLTAKLDAATARRDDLYARWENASEELAAGEEEV